MNSELKKILQEMNMDKEYVVISPKNVYKIFMLMYITIEEQEERIQSLEKQVNKIRLYGSQYEL